MAFDKKNKEPILSENLQNILKRSRDPDSIDSRSDDVYRIKYKISKLLSENQDILHTLHNSEISNDTDEIIDGDKYLGVNIFDFMKTPDLKDKVKSFICFDVQDLYYSGHRRKNIIFRAIVHDDDMKTDWQINRVDLLCAIIKNEFNWTNLFGLHIEKESEIPYITKDGYYFREIIYLQDVDNDGYNRINNIMY